MQSNEKQALPPVELSTPVVKNPSPSINGYQRFLLKEIAGNNVERIDGYAFSNNIGLSQITIPSSVIMMDQYILGDSGRNDDYNPIIRVKGYTEKPSRWHKDWNKSNIAWKKTYTTNWNS